MVSWELSVSLRRHAPLLAVHDYKAIAALPAEPCDSASDRYVSIRALIVLGRYDEAEARLVAEGPGGDLQAFLAAQLDLYRRRGVKKALRVIEQLRAVLVDDAYLRGELNFVVGYGWNIANEFKAATRYLKTAADAYAEAGLLGCEGAALFNLCVAYDHLDERQLFEFCCDRLEGLALQPRSTAVRPLRHLIHRMRALRLVDREQYEEAARSYGEALAVVRDDQRWHDVGALGCMRLYCLVKSAADDEAAALVGALTVDAPRLAPTHLRMLEALESLLLRPFFQKGDVVALRKCVAAVDSVHGVLLYDLALERLVKAADFPLLTDLAREAQTLSLEKQQSLSVVDLQAYEILGLLKCGHLDAGQKLLSAYQSDALERGSTARVQKAARLAELLATQRAVAGKQEPARLLPKTMCLDLRRHTLRLDERTIDLAAKPVMEAFFLALMQAQGPLSLSAVHRTVYGTRYDPVRHDRRLHALISRLRAIAGVHDIVLRRGGTLLIAPSVRRMVRQESKLEKGVDARRRAILDAVAKGSGSLAVSQVEPIFPCTRRTIQLDLAYLVGEGLLHMTGSTRNRRYQSVRTAP